MKKKLIGIFAILALVIIGSLGVVGCGNGEEPEDPDKEEEVAFPEDEITLIVNYGAGGTSDILSRAVAENMEGELGVPITVDNREGGAGTVGVTEITMEDNDGHYIGSLSMAPLAMQPHRMDVPYEIDDFDYLGAYAMWTYGIGVYEDSPYESIEDLVEAAREDPGEVTFTSAGLPNQLAMLGLEEEEDVDFTHVTADSGAEAARDVAGGHYDAVIQSRGELESFVEEGDIRMLASASKEELDFAPDAPTLMELGYDISIESYIGLGGPAGIPEERLEILREAFLEAVQDEEVENIITDQGLVPTVMEGEDYKEFLHENFDLMQEVIEEHDL